MAKTIFYSLAALVRKILFCHSKIKFISSSHCVISSIYITSDRTCEKDQIVTLTVISDSGINQNQKQFGLNKLS